MPSDLNDEYDVTRYRQTAEFDGTTTAEDTAAFAAALAHASADGGGVVRLPPHSVLALAPDTIELPADVYVKGHGESTIIRKQGDGVSLQTAGFDPAPALPGGIYGWGLHDLILDGDGTAGNGLEAFGTGHSHNGLVIKNHDGFGYISRYPNNDDGFGESPSRTGLEGWVGQIKLVSNSLGNIDWDGPHDSTFDQLIAILQGSEITAGRGSADWNVRVGPNGGGQFGVLHPWGNGPRTALRVEGNGFAVDEVYAEGGVEKQIELSGPVTNNRIRGYMQGFPQGTEQPVGLDLGSAHGLFDLLVANCFGGGVDFTNEPFQGHNDVRINGFQSPLVGTPDVTSMVQFSGQPLVGANAVVPYQQIGTFLGRVGFFGRVPVTQPTGVAPTAADIHAALVSLGLIT